MNGGYDDDEYEKWEHLSSQCLISAHALCIRLNWLMI